MLDRSLYYKVNLVGWPCAQKVVSDLIGQEVLVLVVVLFAMVMEISSMMEIQPERSGRKCTVKCASLTNSIFLLLELQSEFKLRLLYDTQPILHILIQFIITTTTTTTLSVHCSPLLKCILKQISASYKTEECLQLSPAHHNVLSKLVYLLQSSGLVAVLNNQSLCL